MIAEKFQAMVMLGRADRRRKDFYDVWRLPQLAEFNDDKPLRAIAAILARRKTEGPLQPPDALTLAFASDPLKIQQWDFFVSGRSVGRARPFLVGRSGSAQRRCYPPPPSHVEHHELTGSSALINAATAQSIEDKRAVKLENQTPSPGTDAALRRLVEQPNYREMTPVVAEATRNQLPQLRSDLTPLGSIQSVDLWLSAIDIYIVKQERGTRHWRILLDSTGAVSTVLVTEGL